ncbi:hypothetical protein [Streptomyces sp. TLI_053]|uniref:hypothetical protein n=1 Tax=Streptomyces sp. TLI_053 TaxID=1855352 RepID=UPI0013520C03|nr:hypothetical protein [Streptomyces sp. TLI_053]
MDEYPVRGGRTCVTVLVDMDTHRPVDVLADRTANAFATRLRDHPCSASTSQTSADRRQRRCSANWWPVLWESNGHQNIWSTSQSAGPPNRPGTSFR